MPKDAGAWLCVNGGRGESWAFLGIDFMLNPDYRYPDKRLKFWGRYALLIADREKSGVSKN